MSPTLVDDVWRRVRRPGDSRVAWSREERNRRHRESPLIQYLYQIDGKKATAELMRRRLSEFGWVGELIETVLRIFTVPLEIATSASLKLLKEVDGISPSVGWYQKYSGLGPPPPTRLSLGVNPFLEVAA